MSIEDEAYREYVFPDGSVYRIIDPVKVVVKRSEIGDSHRVVSRVAPRDSESGGFLSHYVRAGWLAIRWEREDGSEQYDW